MPLRVPGPKFDCVGDVLMGPDMFELDIRRLLTPPFGCIDWPTPPFVVVPLNPFTFAPFGLTP